jgi:general secretion pathway protein G
MRHPQSDSPVRRSESGFSLLEIMIAVMILVLMGGVVMTNLFPNLWKAKRSRAQLDVDVIKGAIEQYRMFSPSNKLPETGDFPQCITEPRENGEQPLLDPDKLSDGKLLDPWGNPYEYKKHSSSSFEVISYGDDGMPGGEGDASDISSKRSGDSGGGGGRR